MAYQPLSSLSSLMAPPKNAASPFTSLQGGSGLMQKIQAITAGQPNRTSPYAAASVGVKAKSPQSNIKPPTNTLSPSQTSGPTPGQVSSNLQGYYSANPQDPTNPAYQTGGSKTAAPNQVGTNPTNPTPVNPYGDSVYGKALFASQQAQNAATNYKAGVTRDVINDQNNPNASSVIDATRADQASLQGTAEENRLATLASTASGIAGQIGGVQYGTPADAALEGASGSGAGSSLNPVNNVQSIAQQVISGQISPQAGYALGGNVQNFQGLLNQEIQKQQPGFDTGVAQGKYDAKQQNTQTSGTAPTNAAASLYGQTYPQVAQLKTTTDNVSQFGNLLLKTMQITNPDGSVSTINPSDVKYGNQTIAGIRSQLSSAQQAQFDTTFAQLRAQIATLLSTGGAQIPTQITADANKIIDGTAPLSTLSATLQRIATEGNILQGNLTNQLNSAGSAIGAPQSGTNNNPAGI